MEQIPNGFYRLSAKALILDQNKKFLLIREEKGWDLPGGGLEYGEKPQEGIKREVLEEMGINVKYIEQNPSYFVTAKKDNGIWIANTIYETQIDTDAINDFKPSDECLEVRFFDMSETKNEKLLPNVSEFIKHFSTANH